jgi:7,8-dihydropterin-6-yl-methyl-4-(beta-D-ribofuranosyl)aminobenzene 5'-phosphate synthase
MFSRGAFIGKIRAGRRHTAMGLRMMCSVLATCSCALAWATTQDETAPRKGDRSLTVTILYDNYAFRKDLLTAWGFACFIEGLEKNILFDTGGDPAVLLSNMEKLGVSPEKIQIIFLSHVHGDHTGGLAALLERNPSVTVFLPASFPERMKASIREKGARVVEVKDPTNVCQDAFSTGEMGTGIKEQALCVRVRGGIAVITGCAHPGIVRMVRKGTEFGKAMPQLVMGGFHMAGYSEKEIGRVIAEFKKLGVVRAGPCHCSGDRTREMFSEAFGERFIRAGVGAVVELQPAR